MLRYSFAAALLVILPSGVFAQHAAGISAGWRMPGPLPVTPGPARYPSTGTIGGFSPSVPIAPGHNGIAAPFAGIWGVYGAGGGGYYPAYPGYGYGYGGIGYAPAYNFDVGPQAGDLLPAIALPPTGNIALVNEFPATLAIEFPAPAEVWVNGLKGEGRPTNEWTFTSPVLKSGMEYTFKVKARWMLDGKTYEYNRDVTVASGNRSRAQVIAGVEVKE